MTSFGNIPTASTEADADPLTLRVQLRGRWRGLPGRLRAPPWGPDTTTYSDDTVPAADTALATDWECFVYADDGTDISPDGTDTATVVAASAPLSSGSAVSGSTGTHSASFYLAQSITLSSAATITDFGIGISSPSSGGTQVIMGLYSDSSGAPGTQLGETALTSVSAGDNTLPATAPFAVSAGTYWIVTNYVASGNTTVVESPSTPATTFYASDGGSSALPASWSGGLSYSDTQFAWWIEGT
jgi:hypothetical protein